MSAFIHPRSGLNSRGKTREWRRGAERHPDEFSHPWEAAIQVPHYRTGEMIDSVLCEVLAFDGEHAREACERILSAPHRSNCLRRWREAGRPVRQRAQFGSIRGELQAA